MGLSAQAGEEEEAQGRKRKATQGGERPGSGQQADAGFFPASRGGSC